MVEQAVQPESKYTRRYQRPFADLPEPLGMFRRLADPDPLNSSHPLHPLAKALFEYGWTAPVPEIAQKLGQEPDQIRDLARILSGVISHNAENDTTSLVIPSENSHHVVDREEIRVG